MDEKIFTKISNIFSLSDTVCMIATEEKVYKYTYKWMFHVRVSYKSEIDEDHP